MKYLVLLLLLGCAQGPNGDAGSSGATGPQGIPGVDLAPIAVIQFCPNPTVYPSTFSEVGFCINNKLYANYSLNNGFLTLIPPGVYTSTGVGSSCDFIVLPNCVIQR